MSDDITGSSNIYLDGVSVSATATVEDAVNAVEVSSDIPPDAKRAFKDFIRENFQSLIENLSNLENYTVPDSLTEYWPIVIEIFQRLFN